MRNRWDVIIVGARCAGATLAALLARAGLATLVVEADARGTDCPMSTHYMQPPGMQVLDRLGVGDRVRAVTPPTLKFRLALDDAEAITPLTEGHPGYCVRRGTLDPLLQQAAEASGAELLFGHRVVELLEHNGVVRGVIVESAHGRTAFEADLVVGADGAHSKVAKLVGAEEYLAAESTRGGYWAYYPAPAAWPFAWDATLEHRGDMMRYVFRSDGDRVLLTTVAPRDVAASWGRSYLERMQQAFLDSPTTRVLAEGKQPIGKVMGLLRSRFFYRTPVGRGWALVGDAGHYKDFVTGQGMTDALFDAERLARAIVSPAREAALEHFWRERDVATLPVHFDALAQGAVGYNNPFTRWVIGRSGKTPAVLDRVRRTLDRELTPDQIAPMSTMMRWMAAALLRGRFDVLAGFMETGKRFGADAKELAARKALLAAAEARLQTEHDRVRLALPAATAQAA
jgi:menaquinone-9 beta-reductase